MKVLIVEDSDAKYLEVSSLLGDIANDFVFLRATNFFEALDALSENSDFEMLILDIFLPMRKDSVPSASVGLDILAEIIDGSSCNQPNHIVCLSEFCADALDIREQVKANLVHLVDYEAGGNNWQGVLKKKVEYVKRRANRANCANCETDGYGCDIAILTASPDVELGQVLKLPGDWTREFCPRNEMIIYRGLWKGVSKDLTVSACEAPGMGLTAACVAAMKIIERERPRYLVMCGILAGTDKALSLGDVVVGSIFFDYGSGKIICNEDGKRIFIPEPQQIPLAPELSAILKDWGNAQRGMKEIGALWSGASGGFLPKLRFGVIASGAAVVQDQKLVDEVKSVARKTVGLEMEAYAIAQAGRYSSNPKPKVLIAKSVCDFADAAKNDSAHEMAAFTSARFVHYLFTTEAALTFSD
jgi:nucleoside phosphorylase/CheY-like chemotaxis protein